LDVTSREAFKERDVVSSRKFNLSIEQSVAVFMTGSDEALRHEQKAVSQAVED
jgi:hypothetical protein